MWVKYFVIHLAMFYRRKLQSKHFPTLLFINTVCFKNFRYTEDASSHKRIRYSWKWKKMRWGRFGGVTRDCRKIIFYSMPKLNPEGIQIRVLCPGGVGSRFKEALWRKGPRPEGTTRGWRGPLMTIGSHARHLLMRW